LVDFNRTKLGVGVLIGRANVDLASVFAVELEQLRTAYPERRLELEVIGDALGAWDSLRLQRVLGNLVVNAIKYGAPGTPVHVTVSGEETEVRFEVRNTGPTIDRSTLNQLFEPLKRGVDLEKRYKTDGSLGLGLFIAREIVKAHGGEIRAQSDNKETVFSVRLPRHEGPLMR